MSIVTEPDLLKYRRTKIVATIGPASSDPQTVTQLIEAGVDVFRVNMSHGQADVHRRTIAAIRESASRLGTHTAILADLCGPKIRTGRFAQGSVTLVAGERVVVTARDVPGDAHIIPSQYSALPLDVCPGNRILLNDGAVELQVEKLSGPDVECLVLAGGPVGDHKGINLPGVAVSAPSLTAKDREDAKFALGQEVDFLALSFVRTAKDIESLRELMHAAASKPMIIAKIEKPEALENTTEILAAADGIMVARGDLGVELNPEQVPLAQHQLIDRAVAANKPVIVATQMLESMIISARPTRAEVTDVSHAVASGTDAVMLSGETAVGDHPVRAVEMMDRVARQTESYHWHFERTVRQDKSSSPQRMAPFGDAVADAAAKLVADTRARAVVVISNRGMTAATISAARPDAPVVAVSPDARVCRRMSLMWGVIPHLDAQVGKENPTAVARRVAKELGLADAGEFIVLVRGFHADPQLNTPTLTLLAV
jgi:pyruvate kinase